MTSPFRRRTAVARRRVRRRAVVLAAGRRHHAHRAAQVRRQRWIAVTRGVLVVPVLLIGLLIGVWLGGSTTQNIGPFRAQLTFTPSLHGDTSVEIPPLGSLDMDTHDGPFHLDIRLQTLDESRTRALAASSGTKALDRVGRDAVDQLNFGVRRLAVQTLGSGLLGALILAGLVFRVRRHTAIAGLTALAVLAGSGLCGLLTFRPDAIQEPKYTGLLTNAPAVIGDARTLANRYEKYRDQLQRMVANMSKLYSTISALPVYEPDKTSTKVLHISDVHLNPSAWTVVRTVADQFDVNMVVDTGDIVDWGTSSEDTSFKEGIASVRVPYVYVRGNHDSAATEAAVASQPNAVVLDDQVKTVGGLTFAGIGDPRFTPDKETDQGDTIDDELVKDSGKKLADLIRASPKKVDVALIHDPEAADSLAGVCPIVLAGHTHQRAVRRLDGTPEPSPGASPNPSQPNQRTLLMVEGSTGGAGLRGLEKADGPLPLALSILYFDSSHTLQAYDDIRVGGTGLTEVSIERHVVTPDAKAQPSPAPSLSPSASPS